VIGAADYVEIAVLALADEVAAVTAAVEKETDLAVVLTDHDDRLQADLAAHEVAGLRDFALVTDIDPDFVPDGLELARKQVRIAIEAAVHMRSVDQLLKWDARTDGRHVTPRLHWPATLEPIPAGRKQDDLHNRRALRMSVAKSSTNVLSCVRAHSTSS
jgi:hypothetical protein